MSLTDRTLPVPALSRSLRASLAAAFREAARARRTWPFADEDRARGLDQQARELEAGR